MNETAQLASNWPIKRALQGDLASLSELCKRSKAIWGNDQDFLDACEPELTYRPGDLVATSVALGSRAERVAATVQVEVTDDVADLLKLFVEPRWVRSGLGREMPEWAVSEARRLGAKYLMIEADPFAAPFYERMGAAKTGAIPIGSIPGRQLPLLRFGIV